MFPFYNLIQSCRFIDFPGPGILGFSGLVFYYIFYYNENALKRQNRGASDPSAGLVEDVQGKSTFGSLQPPTAEAAT
jgi:hypothetical protein